jgi:hypothetical protein
MLLCVEAEMGDVFIFVEGRRGIKGIFDDEGS